MAEMKSEKVVTRNGETDLDKMFQFLSEGPKPVGREEKEFLTALSSDLEQMFRESQAASEPSRRPSRPAPIPPQPRPQAPPQARAAGIAAPHPRTQRRQRRVMKKLLGVEGEGAWQEEPFDPVAYPMIRYAEMYFNDHPRDTGGFSTLSLRRAPRVKDPIPKSEMLVFTKTSNLPTSIVHMHDPENVNLACVIFKDVCKLLRGDVKSEQFNLTIQSTIAYAIDRAELRDEVFCQLIRQVSENPSEEATLRGWHFLTLCTIAFPPTKSFNKVCNLALVS